MSDTRDLDILSAAFHANPFPTLDRMHAAGPVVRVKLPIVGRTWLAVTHDACTVLLKDHQTFARDPANAGSRTQARVLRLLPRTIGLLALNMLGFDDPEHRRLRGLVDQAFQRRTIEALRPPTRSNGDRDCPRATLGAFSKHAPCRGRRGDRLAQAARHTRPGAVAGPARGVRQPIRRGERRRAPASAWAGRQLRERSDVGGREADSISRQFRFPQVRTAALQRPRRDACSASTVVTSRPCAVRAVS